MVAPDRARHHADLLGPLLGKGKHELRTAKAGQHDARRCAIYDHEEAALDELPLVRVRFGRLVDESQRC